LQGLTAPLALAPSFLLLLETLVLIAAGLHSLLALHATHQTVYIIDLEDGPL
jgi:hypothetical protein